MAEKKWYCAGCGRVIEDLQDKENVIGVWINGKQTVIHVKCEDKYLRKRERLDTLMAAFTRMIDNGNAYDADEIVTAFEAAMRYSHRTLQQGFVGALKIALERYGETPENWYDLRNEAAVKWCKRLAEMDLAGYGFPLI